MVLVTTPADVEKAMSWYFATPLPSVFSKGASSSKTFFLGFSCASGSPAQGNSTAVASGQPV